MMVYRLGPVPRAHGSICVIDEVGRMKEDDQGYLLSSMEKGEIPYGRYGYNIKIRASDTFILTSNPSGSSGRFKDALKIYDHEYPLIGQIRDRVDFFFIFRKNDNLNKELNYASDNLEAERNSLEILKKQEEGIKFLQKLYILCQRYHPVLSKEAERVLKQFYANIVVADKSPFSRRLLESLKNACYAFAKIMLKDVVDEYDALKVVEFFEKHIKQHQDAVKVPSIPQKDAAEKIINKVMCTAFKADWIEWLDAVCRDDQQISEYVGFDKEGKRVWSTSGNKGVRNIRKELVRLLPAYKDKILLFRSASICLACKETYAGGDRDAGIDINSIIGRDGSIREDAIKQRKESDLSGSNKMSANHIEIQWRRKSLGIM
jgi:MoxR-like ATPase